MSNLDSKDGVKAMSIPYDYVNTARSQFLDLFEPLIIAVNGFKTAWRRFSPFRLPKPDANSTPHDPRMPHTYSSYYTPFAEYQRYIPSSTPVIPGLAGLKAFPGRHGLYHASSLVTHYRLCGHYRASTIGLWRLAPVYPIPAG